jgi:GNAT superfamily N-acetyltransferase
VNLRTATDHDVTKLRRLISNSAQALSTGYYSTEQITACINHVFGVDTQLIADRSYYVIELDNELAAAGGWSARTTLYGGDQMKSGPDPILNPPIDAARIRAFFVHPDWSRRGLARRLYDRCSHAAWTAGFRRFELMATLPGVPFYSKLGFEPSESVVVTLNGGITVPFVRMTRSIEAPSDVGDDRGLTTG